MWQTKAERKSFLKEQFNPNSNPFLFARNTFKLTGESVLVRSMDVLRITMNYESFSRPISLLPAAGCCAVPFPGPVARMF